MMQKYGKIIHNIQRMLNLPQTEFDIIIGDSFEDEDENDLDGFGENCASPCISGCPKTDEELLALLEEPIYHSDTDV